MGFYDRYVLPRVLDLALRNKNATRVRSEWIPKARGKVLEIGIGSGLNLRFYSPEVQQVQGVDPSLELQRFARKRMANAISRHPVEFLALPADGVLPVADASIDSVVSTWTLCTIPDASRALQEMKRVLKPGGNFIFVEHGRSPLAGIAAWQDRLTPTWKRICGGCHLNRQVDQMIESSGFRIVELKTEYLPGPKSMTYTYQGIARLA